MLGIQSCLAHELASTHFVPYTNYIKEPLRDCPKNGSYTHSSSMTYNTQAYIYAYIHIHPHHITSHPYHHVAYIKIWQQAHFISVYGSNMDLISTCSSSYQSIHITHQTSSSHSYHIHYVHICMLIFICVYLPHCFTTHPYINACSC